MGQANISGYLYPGKGIWLVGKRHPQYEPPSQEYLRGNDQDMSRFLKNILTRHIDITNDVKPYIPGKFEPATAQFIDFPDKYATESRIENNLALNINDDLRFSEKSPDGAIDSDFMRNEEGGTFRNAVKKSLNKPEIKTVSDEKNRVGAKTSKSENQSKSKEKNTKQKIRKSNSRISGEIDRNHESPLKPGPLFSVNKNEFVMPMNPEIQDVRGNSRLKHKLYSENENLSSPTKMTDSVPKTNEFKADVKPTPQKNEEFGNADKFSFRQSGLPDWLSDWKNNPGRESNARETVPESKPVIKVNIGRIEVKAIMQPVSVTPKRINTPKPKLSLEDYLKQRDGVKQ